MLEVWARVLIFGDYSLASPNRIKTKVYLANLGYDVPNMQFNVKQLCNGIVYTYVWIIEFIKLDGAAEMTNTEANTDRFKNFVHANRLSDIRFVWRLLERHGSRA